MSDLIPPRFPPQLHWISPESLHSFDSVSLLKLFREEQARQAGPLRVHGEDLHRSRVRVPARPPLHEQLAWPRPQGHGRRPGQGFRPAHHIERCSIVPTMSLSLQVIHFLSEGTMRWCQPLIFLN